MSKLKPSVGVMTVSYDGMWLSSPLSEATNTSMPTTTTATADTTADSTAAAAGTAGTAGTAATAGGEGEGKEAKEAKEGSALLQESQAVMQRYHGQLINSGMDHQHAAALALHMTKQVMTTPGSSLTPSSRETFRQCVRFFNNDMFFTEDEVR